MELEDLRLFLGPDQPRYRAQQLFDALYKKHVANFSEISNLPQPLLNQLVTISTLGGPQTEKRFDSVDGTRRYLLRLDDNRTIEAVLMRRKIVTRYASPARSVARSIASSASQH